ncbi:MAG: hypothetical protein H6Q52_1052 [Deltaproteobacteria bacterium]|nr:hypothetical protein [Deltaproteobacteria bacterium]
MKKKTGFLIVLVLMIISLVIPPDLYSQGSGAPRQFKAEELEQILGAHCSLS